MLAVLIVVSKGSTAKPQTKWCILNTDASFPEWIPFALIGQGFHANMFVCTLHLKRKHNTLADLEVVRLVRTNHPSQPREPNLIRYVLNLQNLDLQVLELASY